MGETISDFSPAKDPQPTGQVRQPISGTYVGQRGAYRLELRLDLREPSSQSLYQPLNLASGDLFRDVGGGEWEYRSSFLVGHPYVKWGTDEVAVTGSMVYYRKLQLAPSASDAVTTEILRVTIPVQNIHEPPAAATVQITHWGTYKTIFLCDRVSAFLRTIDLEIDRIAGTELPRPFNTHTVATRPADLPAWDLDISRAYQDAGVDMRIVADQDVFAPTEAGTDLKWDEAELHNAMEHHFSQWRDAPQWKLYLLIATHFKLYPQYLVTGIMYDSETHDPNDVYPRQGAAAFYSTMKMAEVWGNLPQAEFDRNYLRTCVHELGHALNMLHSFDKDRPDSLSWMNYPWRYPYGYNLPPAWNGTDQFWQNCRFEFDPEELRHLRHHAWMEVIPGGAAFGALGHDVPVPTAALPQQLETAPVALYVRTRPERYVFHFAEPVTIELKLKNQTQAPMTVPDMLNPELGLLELYIRDPKGQVRPYQPLFKLCGEARTAELPPGEKLYESVFLAYGAGGFYFEEPGEYQIWALYGAGGLRLRSNVLRIRVAFPQTPGDEEMALWTFGREQGHVLYMGGAAHLQTGNDQLREVVERFPDTNLARYVHYCFGSSEARAFKDLVAGQVRPPQPEEAARELEQAVTLLPQTKQSALDNLTHGEAVDLLYDLYRQADQFEEAKSVLTQTARYFKRMEVKPAVVEDLRERAKAIRLKRER
jgi:hypothetical protein